MMASATGGASGAGSSGQGSAKTSHTRGYKPLQGHQLFADWQERGRHVGWRPGKVVKLLRDAKLQLTWRNWIGDWTRKYRLGSLSIRQSKHSPRRIFEALEKSCDATQPKPPEKKNQDKDFSHSY